VDKKLSTLESSAIKDVTSKFEQKNKLIDKCDQLYDQNEATVHEIEEKL
jgi:hypothetical protein